jgi:glycosyltransferase involved in cell wall biosynthesis
MQPFFSIIIPTYNREKHIKETISSVIIQSFEDFELLVIDNKSQDNTAIIVSSFNDSRIQFYQNDENYERCYSRNRGIQLASGKNVLLLDSDDLFEINHLKNWYQFLLADGNTSDCFYVSDKKILKDTLSTQKNPVFFKGLNPISYFFLNPIIPGQICVPANILKRYQFRTDLLIFEDAAFWMELSLKHDVVFNTITSFIYRLHDGNSVNEFVHNVYFKRLKAIQILLNEKRFRSLLPKRIIRFSLNACYLGIIRYHDANSSRFIRFSWVIRSILFFPEYGLKNKFLLLMNTLPLISSLIYFKRRKLY